MSEAHREVFEEDIAPLVLHVEEQSEHEEEVDGRDEDDDHQPAVQPPPAPHSAVAVKGTVSREKMHYLCRIGIN